jgi:hypothetical protein
MIVKAIVRVQGDPSVGLNHRFYIVDDLEIDDLVHGADVRLALRECFARITGEHINDVTVRFVNEDILAAEKELDERRGLI